MKRPSPPSMSRAIAAALAVAALLPGCSVEPACGSAELEPLSREPAYAVVTTDYASSAVALLDAKGELVSSAWVGSGTTETGLSTAMSGDVVLPTTRVRDGELWWIDRFGVDVTTRVAVPSGTVLGQIPLSLPPERDEAAFRANPQDALALDGDRVLVSRFEKNHAADARALDRGNDLVVVDLRSEELVRRIPLASANTEVAGDEGDAPIAILARPSRMVRTGDRVVVGLGRLSADFMTTGPAALAVVEPESSDVQVLELPALRNCADAAPVADDGRRAVVVCQGAAFGSLDERRQGAGAVMVHVPPGEPAAVEHRFEASAHPEAPAVTHGIVSLGRTRAVAAAIGGGEVPDRLVAFDFASGDARIVLEGDGPFALGPGSFDADTGLLLVPDATAGVHRLQLDDDALHTTGLTEVSPCRGLPAREVRPL